ncbi:uncharacterized protein LOC110744184 [Papio anubis]|uniref:uncharacterized protein LOC110744184 n=1 Tax=Papio anubis TaxID=9555 RepID=UPI0012AD753C|nr:uncharacterized protein LOC110744184 [Papio anubis]
MCASHWKKNLERRVGGSEKPGPAVRLGSCQEGPAAKEGPCPRGWRQGLWTAVPLSQVGLTMLLVNRMAFGKKNWMQYGKTNWNLPAFLYTLPNHDNFLKITAAAPLLPFRSWADFSSGLLYIRSIYREGILGNVPAQPSGKTLSTLSVFSEPLCLFLKLCSTLWAQDFGEQKSRSLAGWLHSTLAYSWPEYSTQNLLPSMGKGENSGEKYKSSQSPPALCLANMLGKGVMLVTKADA